MAQNRKLILQFTSLLWSLLTHMIWYKKRSFINSRKCNCVIWWRKNGCNKKSFHSSQVKAILDNAMEFFLSFFFIVFFSFWYYYIFHVHWSKDVTFFLRTFTFLRKEDWKYTFKYFWCVEMSMYTFELDFISSTYRYKKKKALHPFIHLNANVSNSFVDFFVSKWHLKYLMIFFLLLFYF